MTVANALTRNRFRQAVTGLASVSAGLVLTACGLSKQDATSLLPPNVVAEAKLREHSDKLAEAKPLETGTIAPAPRPIPALMQAGTAALAANAPGGNPAREELYIDFQPGSLTLSDREKASIKEAVGSRLLSGDVRLRISAARGGMGNQFDQAIVGGKRARLVNAMLPARMVESVEFDPSLPEDTVRLEFYRPIKRTN